MTTSTGHLWIGGSPCSGKSTVASWLAESLGMALYSCDDAWDAHLERSTPERQPVFHRIGRAAPDDIWLRPLEQQIRESIEIYREEFPFVQSDVADIGSCVVEGAVLLPEMLYEAGVPPNRAIWIVPSEAFQHATYVTRAWAQHVIARTSDPARAWDNWMSRDAGIALAIAEQCAEFGYTCIVNDGSLTIRELQSSVAHHFGLAETVSR